MKQLFTYAAAALVAMSASAAPKHASEVAFTELSPYGVQKMQTNVARIQSALESNTELPGSIKRSFTQGNIEWTLYMIADGELWEYFLDPEEAEDEGINIETMPYYAAQCVVSGYNIATGADYAQFPMLFAYPAKFWLDLANYDGPVDEDGDPTDPNFKFDYSICPFTDLVDSSVMNARFMMCGYYQLVNNGDKDYNGAYAFNVWGFSGAFYGNTSSSIQLTSDWTIENQTEPCTMVEFKSYSSDDNYIDADCNFYFYRGTGSGSSFQPSGAAQTFNLPFEGVAYFNGFEHRVYNIALTDLYIFNAGMLDPDELGDQYPFWGYPEENLQMYYVIGAGPGRFVGFNQQGLAQDTSFNKDMTGIGADTQDPDYDPNIFESIRGYVFLPEGASIENCKFTLNETYEVEMENPLTGKLETYTDWLDPKPYTFVPARARMANGSLAPWSLNYGLIGTYEAGYYNWPAEAKGAVLQTNTTEGFFCHYLDSFGNSVTYTFDGIIQFCDNYNNMLEAVDMESTGEQIPEGSGLKALVANKTSKVTAKNGVITVAASEAANVQIVALNGQVIKNANVAAGQTLNVKAAKGLYIVKVGKEVSKVVL